MNGVLWYVLIFILPVDSRRFRTSDVQDIEAGIKYI